jgi:hypothetical protein
MVAANTDCDDKRMLAKSKSRSDVRRDDDQAQDIIYLSWITQTRDAHDRSSTMALKQAYPSLMAHVGRTGGALRPQIGTL